MAGLLKESDSAKTLAEEKEADILLSDIAYTKINFSAAKETTS